MTNPLETKASTVSLFQTTLLGRGTTRRDFLHWLGLGLGGSLLWERLSSQASVAKVNPTPSPTEIPTVGLTLDARQESLVSQTTDPDYSKLDRALRNREWKTADGITSLLMEKKSNNQGWLDEDSIRKFPSEELKLIDRLWVQHSQGKLGFSVQRRIWQECGSPSRDYRANKAAWQKFGQRVNWQGLDDDWMMGNRFDYSNPQKYQGHLPGIFWSIMGVWYQPAVPVSIFFSLAKL